MSKPAKLFTVNIPSFYFRKILSLGICASILSIFFSAAIYADAESVMPDFYSEPGFNKWRDEVSTGAENIDPFSGSLRFSNIDLVVPGNGGLDIKIRRSYTSNIWLTRANIYSAPPFPNYFAPEGTTGLGWTVNFGRIVKAENPNTTTDGICDDASYTTSVNSTLDDAVLERPDGGQEVLAVSDANQSWLKTFVTQGMWRADCSGASKGLLVYSPDGLIYTMDHLVTALDDEVTYTARVNRAWYPTRIEDGNGNYLTITYSGSKGSRALINRVTASDGREVIFTYTSGYLSSITATDLSQPNKVPQTWTYNYTNMGTGNKVLTEVVRPDGLKWQYAYNPSGAAVAPGALQSVTYPYGATATYTYKHVDFAGPVLLSPSFPAERYFSVAIATKTQGGRNIEPGTWSYTYAPGTENTIETGVTMNDQTTVNFPGGRTIYKHYGIQRQIELGVGLGVKRELWKTGRLVKKITQKEISANVYSTVETESYEWINRGKISSEKHYSTAFDYFDVNVTNPIMLSKTITRDNTIYKTQYTYGASGLSIRPTYQVETGQAGTPQAAVRTAGLEWYPNILAPGQVFFLDQLVNENVPNTTNPDMALSTYRFYDFATGNLKTYQAYGVPETYTYTLSGDRNTRYDARGITWTYLDYYRGIPRQEIQPVDLLPENDILISRTVFDTGTVASETNGRGITTKYDYDSLNRLTFIDMPRVASSDVSISRDNLNYTQKVTRGNYQQVTNYDGFRRPICVTTTDATAGTTISQVTRYDNLGRNTFTSYLIDGACPAWSSSPPLNVDGTTNTYDVLDRINTITHPDSTSRTYSYLPGNKVSILNERNFTTVYTYRSYGDPGDDNKRVLMRIEPAGEASTIFTRDVRGFVLDVTQGGFTRTNTYYVTRPFIKSTQDPETGVTTFAVDGTGNIVQRQVGANMPVTKYNYDFSNRLVLVDYPIGTEDVTFKYDKNGNTTSVDRYNVNWSYGYDQNDNILNENIFILNGPSYTFTRTYDALDNLSSIKYPSTQIVSYAPDSLGRPTQVAPFVNSVSYYPNGLPKRMVYANGAESNLTQDIRQWVKNINVVSTGGPVTDLTYSYDGRGNISSILDTVNSGYNRTLDYDILDRLSVATGEWGTGTITYDATSNIAAKNFTGTGLNIGYNYDATNKLTSTSGDRISTFSYDNYGNITGDSKHTYVYDHASSLRQIDAGDNFFYGYDGNNRRVYANRSGAGVYYTYAKNGQLLGEYGEFGGPIKEYAYLHNKLIAVANIVNELPTVSAGADQTKNEKTSVTFNAVASDPDGELVSIEWTQTSGPPLLAAPVSGPTLSITTPYVDAKTTFIFDVTVEDTLGATATDSVALIVLNIDNRPVANAGADQTITAGDFVTLDGSGSSDAEDPTISYSWVKLSGPSIVINNATTSSPDFTAPTVPGPTTALIELAVTDSFGQTATDTVVITIYKLTALPVANAGPDQTVAESSLVTLDGSTSTDSDGTITNYFWEQLSGVRASFNPNIAQPSFTAPLTTTSEVLTFQLTVTDNDFATAVDTVSITVKSILTADAGPDQKVIETSDVLLYGGATSDALGTVTSYDWIQIGGPTVVLINATTSSPSFIAPEVASDTTLEFMLTAGSTSTDNVIITVTDIPAPISVTAKPTANSITIGWSPLPVAVTYNIYWSITPGVTKTTGTKVTNVTRPYIHTGLPIGTKYYFVVTSENAGGETAESLEAHAIPGESAWGENTLLLENAPPQKPLKTDKIGNIFLKTIKNKNYGIELLIKQFSQTGSWGETLPISGEYKSIKIMDSAFNRNGDGIVVWSALDAGNNSFLMASQYRALTGWSTPVEISATSSSNVHVAINDFGHAIVTWIKTTVTGALPSLVSRELYTVFYDPVNGWELPTLVANSEAWSGNLHLRDTAVKIDQVGNVVMVWVGSPTSGQITNDINTAQRDYFTGWSAPKIIGEKAFDSFADYIGGPFLALDDNGNGMAIWSSIPYSASAIDLPYNGNVFDLFDTAVYAARLDNNTGWQRPRRLSNTPVAMVSGGDLAMSPNGKAIAVWGQALSGDGGLDGNDGWISILTGGLPVYFTWAARFDPATGWEEPVKLDAGPPLNKNLFYQNDNGGARSVAMDDIGNAIIAWEQLPTVQTDEKREIYAARYRDGLGWQGAELISNEGDGRFFPTAVLQNNGNTAIGWNRFDTRPYPSPDYITYFGRHYWVVPGAPVAFVGLPQYIPEETAASLDGSKSYDPEGFIPTYQWTQIEGPAVVLTGADTATPTFTTPTVTSDTLLRFELLVFDVDGLRARVTTSVYVLDVILPVANAGPDQTVNEGTIVYLDGSASTDEDGFVISYSWTQVAGPPVDIINANSMYPTFAAPAVIANIPITIELKVTDDEGAIGTDQVIINVVVVPGTPVANAGPDQAQPAFALVALDGTASSDTDGTIRRYEWLQESGPFVTLTGSTTATPTFTMPDVTVGTTFVFSLTVWDNNNLAASDLVQITTSEITQPPVANAGPDMTYSTNQSGLVLDGAASTDPDGTIVQYNWVQLSGAPVILISDQLTPTASFTSPATPGTLTFELTVTDDSGLTATDQVVIEITQPVTITLTASPNPATRGATVTLDATSSIDPDGTIVSYVWTQSAGPVVVLAGSNTALASFTAPVLASDTVFTFDITITDSAGLTVTGNISVTVLGNQPPQVNAGADQVVNEQDNVTLTGSATDPEAGVLTYLWTQTTGPAVTLTGANTATASFTSPAVTTTTPLGFLLTVTDNEGGVGILITSTLSPLPMLAPIKPSMKLHR